MHRAIVIAIVAVTLLHATLRGADAVFNMRPTRNYERAMNASIRAEAELLVCRARSVKETMKDMECFEQALRTFEYNASWCKQLGALYVTTAQRVKALDLFNRSTYTILEANGFVGPKAPVNMTPVGILKLYHVREGDRGIELGKVWAKAMQLEHRSLGAAAILDDFLTWEADFDEAIDLYRDLGSIADVLKLKRMKFEARSRARSEQKQGRAKRLPEKQKFLAQLAEEVPRLTHDIASRYLSGALTATNVGRNESFHFNRNRCGMTLSYLERYRAADIVAFIGVCLAKWTDYKQLIVADGAPEPYGALKRTPLHTLAAYGTEFFVRHVVDRFPQLLEVTDNFGWLPMHWAVANANKKSVQVLMKAGGAGQLSAKDAGGFTPLRLGCANRRFRAAMEEVARAALGATNPCGSHEPPSHIVDDEDDADDGDDDVPLGGQWSGAAHTPETAHCEFDIRSGASMSHHELVGTYLHQSRPVVLRNVIPTSLRTAFMKKKLKSKHFNMSVRVEEFPAAQHYGGVLHNVTTLREWMNRPPPQSFATVEASKGHLLGKEARWVPSRLVAEGGEEDAGYVATDDTWPHIAMASAGATTNHVVASTHELFALVHGIQTWALSPPQDAVVTRGKWRHDVTDASLSKCTIHSGDVLIIPQLWGSAYRSIGESIGVHRRLVWK